jgi:hypothetical protein
MHGLPGLAASSRHRVVGTCVCLTGACAGGVILAPPPHTHTRTATWAGQELRKIVPAKAMTAVTHGDVAAAWRGIVPPTRLLKARNAFTQVRPVPWPPPATRHGHLRCRLSPSAQPAASCPLRGGGMLACARGAVRAVGQAHTCAAAPNGGVCVCVWRGGGEWGTQYYPRAVVCAVEPRADTWLPEGCARAYSPPLSQVWRAERAAVVPDLLALLLPWVRAAGPASGEPQPLRWDRVVSPGGLCSLAPVTQGPGAGVLTHRVRPLAALLVCHALLEQAAGGGGDAAAEVCARAVHLFLGLACGVAAAQTCVQVQHRMCGLLCARTCL